MMTPQLPTRDVTSNNSHQLRSGKTKKLDESRYHAHGMIEEMISLMKEKKSLSQNGVKKV